jgi:hypothetical protein
MTISLVQSQAIASHERWRAQILGSPISIDRCPLVALEYGILDAVSRAAIDIARNKMPGFTDRAKIGWGAIHCNGIMNNPAVANPCPEAACGDPRRVSDYLNELREEAETVLFTLRGLTDPGEFNILLPNLKHSQGDSYYVQSVPVAATDEEIHRIIRQHFNKD